MGTLWIREYTSVGRGKASNLVNAPAGALPIVQEPGTDQTPVTTSTSSAQSAAFADTTWFVTLYSDVAGHYVVGSNPTATTSHLPLAAGVEKTIGVTPGQKVAFRTAS
jgi:hypothetical protein